MGTIKGECPSVNIISCFHVLYKRFMEGEDTNCNARVTKIICICMSFIVSYRHLTWGFQIASVAIPMYCMVSSCSMLIMLSILASVCIQSLLQVQLLHTNTKYCPPHYNFIRTVVIVTSMAIYIVMYSVLWL